MKFKSEIVTQASGSIGGVTYSHNKGGMYRRARAIPTNPNSSDQQSVRMYLAVASANWSNVLTAGQRTAWNDYAALTPVLDKLGDMILLSGQQMYIRSFTTAMRAGVTAAVTGPVTPGLTELNGVTVSTPSSVLTVTYDNTDAWAVTTNGALLVQTTRMLNPGVNYSKGPYRLLGAVLGDTTTPPTSPLASGFNGFGQTLATGVGMKLGVRIKAIDSTGRTSPVVTQVVTIA